MTIALSEVFKNTEMCIDENWSYISIQWKISTPSFVYQISFNFFKKNKQT